MKKSKKNNALDEKSSGFCLKQKAQSLSLKLTGYIFALTMAQV
ncbi:hypothetical protein [Pseudoalteromonas aurantia]|nr:hypothetical protein [Pseudoalteromonas aurantia]